MDPETKSINEIVDILKRRKMVFIVTAIPVVMIALAVAILWPPVYKSSATILIEEQEMPRDFVATTVTSYAEQRLQSISQRIMSTTRLLEVINRFNLYEDMRKKTTNEEAVERMRKDIKFETISAEGMDPRSGREKAITIAFTVSYEGRSPGVVQEVATVLSSLYLQENLSQREQQTAGVSKFLNDETKILQDRLTELNAQIADFKGKHVGALPELFDMNLQSLDRSETDVMRLKDELRTLRQKESTLIMELSSVPTLRAKLAQLQSKYSDKHPDVIKTKREIADLEGRTKKTNGGGPDKGKSDPVPVEQMDNPAYATLAPQLAAIRADIESTQRQVNDAVRRRAEYQRRIEASPKVDETYKALLGERNAVQAKFDDLTKKSMEARVAQGLEKGQMGERFTLIDPARLPGKPVKPNRIAIILIGFILGIGGGVGVMVLQEAVDHSVRDSHSLALMTGVPVLGAIPAIFTKKDIMQRKKRQRTLTAGTLAGIVVALVLVHFLVADFTILWARLLRRFP